MKALSLLIKPASSACNLRCKYCFYHDLASIRNVKSYGMMSEGVIETIVKKAYESAENIVTFGFQGGEPTLRGLDFFKLFVELTKKYNKNNIKTSFALQTNGMVIDEDWAKFFADNKFLVGLSLDGNKEIHDMNRIDANGEGTFKRVFKAAKILDEYKAEYNILCVVTKSLARHCTKVYKYLKSKGFNYLQFIPCLDSLEQNPGESVYSLTPKDYGRFLNTITDLWYEDFLQGSYTSVRMLDNLVLMLKGHPPESCDMVGRCSANAIIEADGGVYPCDFYMTDEWRLGSVIDDSFDNLIKNETAMRFIETSMNISQECKDCEFYFICRGGCRRQKEPIQNGKPLENYFCEAYKLFYSNSLNKLKHVAKMI